jgi:uncharacterized protein YccT (UPF0319 family)
MLRMQQAQKLYRSPQVVVCVDTHTSRAIANVPAAVVRRVIKRRSATKQLRIEAMQGLRRV